MRRLVALAFVMAALAAVSARAADVGDRPALSGKELSGRAFDLKNLQGKVVIVNFWATWCGPCRAEMPMLDKFYQEHKAQGLMLIGVSEDRDDKRDDVKSVMAPLHYPTAMIGDLDDDDFGRSNVLPVTYVVDAGGVLRTEFPPEDAPLTEAKLAAAILPLLSKTQ